MTPKQIIAAAAVIFTFFRASAQASGYYMPEYDPLLPPAHDPAAVNCDGTWYLFSTGYGVSIFSSKDLVSWEYAGRVFDTPPRWAVETVKGYRGHTWAPDISFHDGVYYLFYSCSSFGSNNSAIGVATNTTLDPSSEDYRWIDHGEVVRSVPGRDDWNAIDPNLFIEQDGSAWLSFGSFWGGIKLFRLDDTLTMAAEPQEWYSICSRPEGTAPDTSESDDAIKKDPRGREFNPGNGAVEAPFIIKRNDWYYLLVSYDLCCRGAKSTYKVVCGRSRKVTGPYIDKDGVLLTDGGGSVVVSGNDRFPGVGHCAVINSEGDDFLLFHGYDKKHGYNGCLLTRPVQWTADGWPTVTI